MNKLLSNIVSQFGFTDFNDFLNSLVHFKVLAFTIPMAAVFASIEGLFGFPAIVLGAFASMAIVELVSGLWASRIRNVRWSSKKFGRFGFKLLVWMLLIGVAQAFKMAFAVDANISQQATYQIFSWLHSAIVVYVVLEYIISIIENLTVITGQKNNRLLTFLNLKMDRVLGEKIETPKSEEKKDSNE